MQDGWKKNLFYLSKKSSISLHFCFMWLLEQQCTFWVLGLWCFHIYQAVLNQRRKEKGEKRHRRDPVVCFFHLSPSLTGKASDILRQKTNSVSPVKSSVKASQDFFLSWSLSFFFFCPFLFPFSSVFAFLLFFFFMDAALWELFAQFSNNNISPTSTTGSPFCQNPTDASISFREPWTDNKH